MTRLSDEQVAEALEGTRFYKGFVGMSEGTLGEWYWSFGTEEALDALRLLAEAKWLIELYAEGTWFDGLEASKICCSLHEYDKGWDDGKGHEPDCECIAWLRCLEGVEDDRETETPEAS